MEDKLITVGEIAKMLGTTVRTLQYYDREGLLKPSAMSEGGRRLYSSKDVVKLHQILSFKYLGFSLDEIKSRLFSLDEPAEVIATLEHQRQAIKEQISNLEEAVQAIDLLSDKARELNEVDFSKYAAIIQLLRSGSQGYWAWKYLDTPLKQHILNRYRNDDESAQKVFETYKEVLSRALKLKRRGESPDSADSLEMAKKWWDMILEFTGGDMSLLPQLEEFNNNKEIWDNEMAAMQAEVDDYLEKAMGCYLSKMNGGEGNVTDS